MDKTPGQIAHDAYHHSHEDGPFNWDSVLSQDKRAWEASAKAVQVAFIQKMMEGMANIYYNDSTG